MTASELETFRPDSSLRGDSILADVLGAVTSAPKTTAVRCEETSMTYEELWDAGMRVAGYLRAEGIGGGDVVALSCRNSSRVVATLLGIQLAGAAYAPAAPDGGRQDLNRVANVTGAKMAIVDTPLNNTNLREVRLDGPLAADHGEPMPFPRPEQPAYILCTSGSTGDPRAVVVNHGNLNFSTTARREIYPDAAVFLLLSPIFFDSSVAGIWGTLTSGGTLVVVSDSERRDPPRLASIINYASVTHTLMIPSLYRELLHSTRSRAKTNLLESIDSVTVAGEILPESLIQLHFDCLPNAALVNEYGPTEATVWATFRRYTSPARSTIGRPVPGVLLRVCDDEGKGVGVGEVGELHIGGPGVTDGYLGDPKATAESFIDAPNNSDRWYKSGDLVRLAENVEFEFIGRRDRQVKVRGRRVELSAVEFAIDSLETVRQVVADATPDGTRVQAHVVVEQGSDSDTVRRLIRAIQPSSSRPDDVHLHETLPKTANGKVDVTTLREIVGVDGGSASQNDKPTVSQNEMGRPESHPSQVRKAVTTAWTDLLEVDDIDDDQNFFDVGGNSMLLIRLQNQLIKRTGCDIPIVALFQHTTIGGQVELVLGLADGSPGTDDEKRARRARAARARRQRLGGQPT